jgi:hypothetical protein
MVLINDREDIPENIKTSAKEFKILRTEEASAMVRQRMLKMIRSKETSEMNFRDKEGMCETQNQ